MGAIICSNVYLAVFRATKLLVKQYILFWKITFVGLQEEREILSPMTNFHFGVHPVHLIVFKRTKILVSVSRFKTLLKPNSLRQ